MWLNKKSVPCIPARFSKTHAQMLLGETIENDFYCDLDFFSRQFSRRRATQAGRTTRKQNGFEGDK